MARLPLLVLPALLLACPQAQPSETPVGKAVGPGADDPRVVSDGTDLYPGKAPAPHTVEPSPSLGSASPGTGRPDETNGKCRLFAPERQGPQCCVDPLGFDVAAVQSICGLEHYLGESFLNSCGFYFLPRAGQPLTWFRLSVVRGEGPRAIAEEQAAILRRTDARAVAEPLPAVPGAYWVHDDEYRWAYLPGWEHVRLFTWKSTSCPEGKVDELLRAVAALPERGPRRSGLLPSSAPPP